MRHGVVVGRGRPTGAGLLVLTCGRQHEVVRGDNLWLIAKERLAAARSGGSGEPTNREVARYWIKVVEANKHHLRSGNPDLIYPDEEIILPPVGD